MACRRVTSATCTWARPPARPSLLWTHRRDTRAPASTKARRSIKLFTDLPTSALDGATGNPLPALEPFVTQEKRKRRPKVAKQCQSQSQEPQQEVEADTSVESPFARLFELGPDGQEWPPLAKDVLSNLVRFPGCILLTRVGGFYESYFEQAPLLAGMLSIKLANRSWGGRSVPMAGFPLSQLEKYLKVLVQDHRKLVAICEEFRSDDDGRVPELNEKVDIVRRVTRVVSPGTLIDEKWLDPLRNNFILSVSRDAINDTYGLAWLDLSTSDLHVSCCQGIEELRDEVHRVSPSEIVLEQQSDLDRMQEIIDLQRSLVSIVPSVQDADFLGALESQATQTYPHTERLALANLTSHLRSRLLDIPADAVITAGLVRHHTPEDFMAIDGNTLDALEVRETNREGGIRGSLVSTVRRTLTKGGSRLLVEWLTSPSTSWEVITQRHAVVEYFVNNKFVHEDIRALFRMIQRGDISRTLQRVATARNDEQDLLEVRDFARFISALQQAITELRQGNKQETEGMDLLNKMICSLSNLDALADELGNAIDERVMDDRIRAMEALETDEEGGTGGSVTPARKTPATKSRTEAEEPWGAPFEHLIRPSSSKVLTRLTREYDRLRRNATALQTSLKERFPSSKVSLRFLLGQGFVVHFAGISKANGSDEADDLAVATKTKTTRTFYHDPWSQIGSRILRLQEELKRAENAELRRLRRVVMEASSDLRRNAQKVDELDCLLGFAQLAGDMRLVRPTMVRQTDGQGLDEDDIPFEVEAGRHIGVEGGLLEHGRAFTPNDLNMDSNSRIHFITGPNMGGKSTYLRQNALICILAQAGSFVPADSARLGIVDRLFSRVGAKDDLFRDRSTFMVEMLETAEILRRATRRSFVVADEIGRGTTTDVGVAIAFATLKTIGKIGCRTIFATHLHELADLMRYSDTAQRAADPEFRHVRFASTDVHENESAVTYLHRIRSGVNRESHGLTVAALAGMPAEALDVARYTLSQLASKTLPKNRVSSS